MGLQHLQKGELNRGADDLGKKVTKISVFEDFLEILGFLKEGFRDFNDFVEILISRISLF